LQRFLVGEARGGELDGHGCRLPPLRPEWTG
jgi:hypothetical protein